MLSVVKSIALQGLDGFLVRIEVDISSGLPAWDIVGLPDVSVKESKERVRTAIKNCGINLLSRKYVINLSPANIKKQGSIFDLSIAIGVLQASEEIMENVKLDDTIFIGELSLDGGVEAVNGVLPMCIEALKFGIKRVIVPQKNTLEASCVEGLKVIGVSNLREVIDYLNGRIELKEEKFDSRKISNKLSYNIDFNEVKGQAGTKRALEIAVARKSQCLYDSVDLVLGKTMMAKRVVTILPDMSFEESLETSKIHSIAGTLKSDEKIILSRPFRSPHHTISATSMIGRRLNSKAWRS